ncbi:hypothetical protein N5C55_27640 [Pseudomonas otitidis]|uniref:tetratricopeptide repeat protein n=1 Tax=Metapseudomonas otitidis TaxID=319939 RepID=UPI0024480EE4|nr:tetratricopeptide repeat protein [Pseudomonas otitidis]MDH1104511.1 hypothetical protein [Pseudomonas otitidis]MDH1161964.1 hypothetical protein [Pseudomonas otitidis]MDH1167802.1 hypothetical protein [Pseudomonas otitidis]
MTADTTSDSASRLARLLGFLGHDPGNPQLLLDAMSLAIELGDTSSGRLLVEHVKAHGVADAQVCAQAAHLLLQAGDYAQAGVFGDKAVAAGIHHPAVIYNTAFAHFYSGGFKSASELLTRLTAEGECPVPVLLMHARALHQQELTEDAEPLALRAWQMDPSNIEARGLLALLQYENDDNAAALANAREVLSQDPDQLDALIACASAHFEQGSIEASRKAWLHTVSAHPNCGRAWSGLGQLEFQELEFVQAEEHLKTAVQYMPDHIGTWHLLAWIYILRGASAPAREALDKSYALDRNFGETHGGLAVVDVMDGQDDKARTGIRRALKLNPNGLAAKYAEMLLLQKAGRPEDASKLVDEVLERSAPSGDMTGRMLIEQWLKARQGGRTQAPPGQH